MKWGGKVTLVGCVHFSDDHLIFLLRVENDKWSIFKDDY